MDLNPKNSLIYMLTVFNDTQFKHEQCLFTGGDIPYLHNGEIYKILICSFKLNQSSEHII